VFGLAAGCADSSTNAAGISDEDLEKTVSARIGADPQLRAYDIDVDADVANSRVTLTGTVPTQTLRMQAIDTAKDAGTDLVVTDQLKVDLGGILRQDYTEEMAREARESAARAGEVIGEQLDDAWIHTKIRAKLASEGEFPFGGINVDVMKNVVTLRGSVDSVPAKARAERIAQETEGVSQVKNQLMIKTGG
jgi:osmotically-inducible protein OsmY